jgi:hypothetical protein
MRKLLPGATECKSILFYSTANAIGAGVSIHVTIAVARSATLSAHLTNGSNEQRLAFLSCAEIAGTNPVN